MQSAPCYSGELVLFSIVYDLLEKVQEARRDHIHGQGCCTNGMYVCVYVCNVHSFQWVCVCVFAC